MRMKRSAAMLLCAFMVGVLGVAALPSSAKAVVDYTMDFSQTSAVSWSGRPVDYSTTDDSGTGWSWTHANKTLTLNGLHFTTTVSIAMKLPAGATIALTAGSSNSVETTFQGNTGVRDSSGIWCLGMLTVSGGGSLTAAGGSSASGLDTSVGVETNDGITLSGSCLLTGIGQNARDSYGVAITMSGGRITVEDSASLTGRGGMGSGAEYGVFLPRGGSVTVQDSGSIEGSSSSYVDGVGISSPSTTVKGGTLIASAQTYLAMAEEPSLTQYANYRWRTTKTGAYTDSSVTPFSFSRSLDYIEIGSSVSPVPPVPKTGDVAPIGLLIGLLLLSGVGLTTSVVGMRKRRGA